MGSPLYLRCDLSCAPTKVTDKDTGKDFFFLCPNGGDRKQFGGKRPVTLVESLRRHAWWGPSDCRLRSILSCFTEGRLLPQLHFQRGQHSCLMFTPRFQCPSKQSLKCTDVVNYPQGLADFCIIILLHVVVCLLVFETKAPYAY